MSVFVTTKANKFYYDGSEIFLKGLNLEPTDYSWNTLWTEWDWTDISAKLAYLSGINGINTVRVMIDKGGINLGLSTLIANIEQLLTQLDSYNCRLIFSFFAWTLPDTAGIVGFKQTAAEAWANISGIVKYFKDDNRILAWELKNEWMNNVSSESGGYTQANVEKYTGWLKTLYDNIKDADANHLVFSGGNSAYQWWKAGLGTSETINEYTDALPLHIYPSSSSDARMFMDSSETISIPYMKDYLLRTVGLNIGNMPVFVEETGKTTEQDSPTTAQLETQRYWAESFTSYLSKKDISGFIWWSIKDGTGSVSGRKYGLVDVNGNYKPAYYWFKQWQINDMREENL